MAQQNTGGTKGLGLAPNIASVLCYAFAPVSSIILLLLEKDNKDVSFHAWQGTLFGAAFYVLIFGIRLIATLFGYMVVFLQDLFLSFLLPIYVLIGFILWVVCMIKAYQGERWRIPFLGDIAAKKAGI